MSSIIDGMQVLNAQIGRNIETSARFESELFKINRQYNTLTEMMLDFRASVDRRFDAVDGRLTSLEGRLDAISLRLDEIEASCHENAVLIKELRIESNRQHNEVLNALQIGLQNKTELEELTERVAELERRLSSL
jgi:chromosome segregation ATPase